MKKTHCPPGQIELVARRQRSYICFADRRREEQQMNWRKISTIIGIAFVGGLVAGYAHSNNLVTLKWVSQIPAFTGSCELRAEITDDGRNVNYIADWESRTRFSGFWPNVPGDYTWARSTTGNIEFAEHLEVLIVTFDFVDGKLQPTKYEYHDKRPNVAGIELAPRLCPALALQPPALIGQ
jgi:hypothetical protein